MGQVSPWAISCGSGGFISWWGTVGLNPSWVSGPREGDSQGVLKDPQCGGAVGGGGMLSEEFALMVGKEDFCPGK